MSEYQGLSDYPVASQQPDTATVTATSGSRPSYVRRPRGVLKINGAMCQFIRCTVENKSHFAADSWIAEIEPFDHPQGFGWDFWDQADPDTTVEILYGLLGYAEDVYAPPSNLTSLIFGQVDDVEIDPARSKLVLTGRDLTARLIDRKTSNKWPDKTASQIVSDLATEVGLTPVITDTKTPAGTYYANSYVKLQKDLPMWDLVTFLAQQEGFQARVKGQSLIFGEPPDDDPDPVQIVCQRAGSGLDYLTVTDLKLHRSLTLANDISITVLSHGTKKNQTIKAVASRSGIRGGTTSRNPGGKRETSLPSGTGSKKGADSTLRPSQGGQNYRISRPNLTQDQANQLAQNMLDNISKWERTFEAQSEGDETIDIDRMARISGTLTTWDGKYFLTHVRHEMSIESGYSLNYGGKNHPTDSEPVL